MRKLERRVYIHFIFFTTTMNIVWCTQSTMGDSHNILLDQYVVYSNVLYIEQVLSFERAVLAIPLFNQTELTTNA